METISKVNDALLPFSLEAEQAVIGAILADAQCLIKVTDHIAKKDSFYKTVGNICMDMSFIDITNTDFNVGDRVEIFGKNNDRNNVAKSINTIAYELISSISNRVVRVYLKD